MRLLIAAVGKLKQGPERELLTHYFARIEALGRKLSLGPLGLIEIPESRAASATVRCRDEAKALLAKLPPSYRQICLDRAGTQLSSAGFAVRLGKFRDGGADGLAFVIGGADGLGGEALAKADMRLSLGAMTLPHGLVRIVLAEQLYRAETILSGHPYHRG